MSLTMRWSAALHVPEALGAFLPFIMMLFDLYAFESTARHAASWLHDHMNR